MRKLYMFEQDWSYGALRGIFVADDEQVKALIGQEAHFGEELGKHSDCTATIDETDITELTDDQEKIDWFLSVNGTFGLNPLDYIEGGRCR
jgi:hypothetical protein